jgi:hypothetical protein
MRQNDKLAEIFNTVWMEIDAALCLIDCSQAVLELTI